MPELKAKILGFWGAPNRCLADILSMLANGSGVDWAVSITAIETPQSRHLFESLQLYNV